MGNLDARRGSIGKPYILLAEDNADDRFFTIRTLERNGFPFPIECVSDGAEAIEYLKRKRTLPAVILLDSCLPKMNGPEVLSILRSDARMRLVPVVLLSGSDNEHREEWQDAPNARLEKPLVWSELAVVLGRLGVLGRSKRVSSQPNQTRF